MELRRGIEEQDQRVGRNGKAEGSDLDRQSLLENQQVSLIFVISL